MHLVAEVHLELDPIVVLKHGHPPRAGHVLRELPEDVEAVLVRGSFEVCLDDRVAETPDVVLDGAKSFVSSTALGAREVLTRVTSAQSSRSERSSTWRRPASQVRRAVRLRVLQEMMGPPKPSNFPLLGTTGRKKRGCCLDKGRSAM